MFVTMSAIPVPRPESSLFVQGKSTALFRLSVIELNRLASRPPLLTNLKHVLLGEPLEDWIPQDEFLGIINIGAHSAIASKGGMCVEGDFVFTLKDNIDVTWMAGYQKLPTMDEMMAKKSANSTNSLAIANSMEPNVFELLAKAKMR
jgi:hypothetical protein